MKKLYGIAIVFATFACANMHAANKEASMQGVFEKLKVLLNKYAAGDWNSWNQQDWDNLAYLQGDAAAIEPAAKPFLDIYLKDYSTIKDAAKRKQLVGLVTNIAPRILSGAGLKRVDMLTLKTEIASVASLTNATGRELEKIFQEREKELVSAVPAVQPKLIMPQPVKQQPAKVQPTVRVPIMPKPVPGKEKPQPKPLIAKELERAAERKRAGELGPVAPKRVQPVPVQPKFKGAPKVPVARHKPVVETAAFERHYAEFQKKQAAPQPKPIPGKQGVLAVPQPTEAAERAEEGRIVNNFIQAAKDGNVELMEMIYHEAQVKFSKFRAIPADFLKNTLRGMEILLEQVRIEMKAALKRVGQWPTGRMLQHGIGPREYEAKTKGWESRKMAGEVTASTPQSRTELAEFNRLNDEFYTAAAQGDLEGMDDIYDEAEETFSKFKTISEAAIKYRLKKMKKIIDEEVERRHNQPSARDGA